MGQAATGQQSHHRDAQTKAGSRGPVHCRGSGPFVYSESVTVAMKQKDAKRTVGEQVMGNITRAVFTCSEKVV